MALTTLVVEGDSLTSDPNLGYVFQAAGITDAADIPGSSTFGSAAQSQWPFDLNGVIAINRAIGGSRIDTNPPSGPYPGDAMFRAPTMVDPVVASGYPGSKSSTGRPNLRPVRKYVLYCMFGTNPDSSNPTTQTNLLREYLQDRVAAGFTGIAVGTLVSRGDGIIADFEAYRQAVNTIIRSVLWQDSIGATAIAIADFGNQPVVGAPGACDNPALFTDTIHLTVLGNSYLAPLLQAAIASVASRI